MPFGPPAITEGDPSHALLAQAAQIDVSHESCVDPSGKRSVSVRRKPSSKIAAVSVPGEIGCGLAGPGRRIRVSRHAPHRLGSAQKAAVLGFPDGDIAGRQVEEHLSAGERRGGARRLGHPHILADLDMERERARPGGPEQEVDAERDPSARQGASPASLTCAPGAKWRRS